MKAGCDPDARLAAWPPDSAIEQSSEAQRRGHAAAELRMLSVHLDRMAARLECAEPQRVVRRSTPGIAIERSALDLEREATQILAERRLRGRYIDPSLLGEPAWDILLDLFRAGLAGKRVAVTEACHAASIPATTALRWVEVLRSRGLIHRVPSQADRRRVWLELDPAITLQMARYLVARRPT